MRRICLAALTILAAAAQEDAFQAQRSRMVSEQMESRGVRDRRVLRAMRETPRHLFVPQELQAQAYEDHPLPIGHGQTISQPYIVAAMTELLDLKPDSKLLEIGTGSGYQTAVASMLTQHVYSIEIVPELAKSSQEILARMGRKNVTVRHGDGYLGWPEEAPFDRILVTAAPPEIPQALIEQLKPGGRMVVPVGKTPANQELLVVEKRPNGELKKRSVFPVRFVPMVPGR